MLARLKIKLNLLNLNLKRQTSSFQFRAAITEWKFLLTFASWSADRRHTVSQELNSSRLGDAASVDWKNAEFKIYTFIFTFAAALVWLVAIWLQIRFDGNKPLCVDKSSACQKRPIDRWIISDQILVLGGIRLKLSTPILSFHPALKQKQLKHQLSLKVIEQMFSWLPWTSI